MRLVDAKDPYATIHANWLNGVPKADQKATVKALIRLGLTPVTAPTLAKGAPGVDAATLQSAATKVATGADLTEPELQVLGRFDATIDAQLDAGFERAEQQSQEHCSRTSGRRGDLACGHRWVGNSWGGRDWDLLVLE